MNRREFLKSLAVTAVAIATPIGAIATSVGKDLESQDLAETILCLMEEQADADFEELCVPWLFAEQEYNIRDRTQTFAFRRRDLRRGVDDLAWVAIPVEAKPTQEEALNTIRSMYP